MEMCFAFTSHHTNVHKMSHQKQEVKQKQTVMDLSQKDKECMMV